MIDVTVKCNYCGSRGYVKNDIASENKEGVYLHSFPCNPGYGSEFDGDNLDFHLCDNCLQLVMQEMKYNPAIY